ncbi:MAG: TlpA family protein disulfide reductase [Flavobacteriales bacterium]
MKKLLLWLLSGISVGACAQLTNGSTAPDFALSDIDGTQHNLYEYLDAGKTVYIDFWATHCPNCWNYHNQGHVEDLHTSHGPAGSSSQDVIVIGIEVDPNNGLNEFNGISGVTQGNWLAGISYPILNPEGNDLVQIANAYAVNYYPLVYAICPDKTVKVVGTQTAAVLYEEVEMCAIINVTESKNVLNEISVTYSGPQNEIRLSGTTVGQQMTVIATDGRLVQQAVINDGSHIISTTGWGKGLYAIRIGDAAGRTVVHKIYVG